MRIAIRIIEMAEMKIHIEMKMLTVITGSPNEMNQCPVNGRIAADMRGQETTQLTKKTIMLTKEVASQTGEVNHIHPITPAASPKENRMRVCENY